MAVLVALFGATPLYAQATDHYVTTEGELYGAILSAQPGDTITLADGRWTDAAINFKADGVEGDSIRLRAETPGSVVLDGASTLRIAGDYLVVDGLRFEGGALSGGHVIEFRNNAADLAHHSRLTNTSIVDYNPERTTTGYKWVSLYGTHNRVDHCYFAGKTNDGTTLVVWLEDEARHEPNHHRIDHNYFGPRPELGRNGGETIRIGTSTHSMQDSRTLVEHNLFERCDGETEIISNKSGRNVFRYNTFDRSQGTLTLRHGNGARVEGNFFLGGGVGNTGGVRVIGEDHVVVNNYFERLEGSGFRAALSVMNGVPDSPLNRYFQVKNALIAFNTFVYVQYPLILGAGADDERTLPPTGVTYANNVVLGEGYRIMVKEEDEPVDMTWAGNVMYGRPLGIDDPGGIAQVDPLLQESDGGLWRPAEGSPLIDAAVGDYPSVELDVDRQVRQDGAFDVGADERVDASTRRRPLTPADVGPAWMHTSTGVERTSAGDTGTLDLSAGYPNPFATSTTLTVTLSHAAHVEAKVYDLLGREVAVVLDRPMAAGTHLVTWSADGQPSGSYVCVVRANGRVARQHVVLVK